MTESPKSQANAKLYLIDISSFIFRAFFAIRSLKSRAGEPTNAVFGVATMLARLIEEAKPEYLAVVYDSKEPSFRKEMYAEYKANRSETPEDLIPQFDRIEQLVSAFGIPSYRMSGIEADDLIASLTERWEKGHRGDEVVIVSGDKDLMQLVTDRVSLWDTMNNRHYGPDEVLEKFGVRPDQIRDYLGLVGDSSDNIPGVPGFGPKTVTDLLKEFGTLPQLLKAAEAGKVAGKKGQTLVAHRADAELSAQLATVRRDLEVDASPERLRYQFEIKQELLNLLTELDFHTLVKKWSGQAQSNAQSTPSAGAGGEAGRFTPVQTEDVFNKMVSEMKARGEWGFDLETTSLNPREAKVVGIAIATSLDGAYYVPVGHVPAGNGEEKQLPLDWVMDRLKPLLEDPRHKKIGQNLKYDWSILRESGIHPQGIGADTMVASYVLDPSGRHNLKGLAERYLGYAMLTYEEVCGKGKGAITFDQVPIELATRYSAEDAWIAYRLWAHLLPLLEAEKLMPVFAQIDLPLVDILCRMELAGVCLNREWLGELSKRFGDELVEIEKRVQAYSPDADEPVNLNSPKQLAVLLFEVLKLPTQSKTKTGYSTDAGVLEALSPLHPVPKLLLEYREIAKLKGTYVDPLPLLCDAKTGKIHAGFHQAVAATGRLSSADPNLQNIPTRTQRGAWIRKAFLPSPGCVLLSADYNQVELRLLAHMSGDPELVRAFRSGEDVHRQTAGDIFDVSLKDVTDDQRRIAKAINFGLMYGKTAFGLAQELGITRKEAQSTIDRYFAKYSGVKTYLDRLISDAKEHGYAVTLSGRKRPLPDIKSRNPAVRNNAERMAMNTPIQGTAADLMKLAMIEIDAQLTAQKLDSKLIIQVHDEVVLDCPKGELAQVTTLVKHAMESAMKLDVPLKVETSSGPNWAEL